jgi:hypothetical protein
VSRAAELSRTVADNAERAADLLDYFRGRIMTGHGELFDPSAARGNLREASLKIATALSALSAAEKAGWTARLEPQQ